MAPGPEGPGCLRRRRSPGLQAGASYPRGRHVLLAPELLRRDAGAFCHRAELGPGDLAMRHPGADAAVRAGDDVLAADEVCVAHETLGDELRVLDHIRDVADHARDEDLVARQL